METERWHRSKREAPLPTLFPQSHRPAPSCSVDPTKPVDLNPAPHLDDALEEVPRPEAVSRRIFNGQPLPLGASEILEKVVEHAGGAVDHLGQEEGRGDLWFRGGRRSGCVRERERK